MSQPPENLEPQHPDVNSTQQADSSTSQNVVHGNQNRAVQGNENQGVLGDNNTVVQGNNSTQNIHITNYYYREDIRNASVQPASDDSTDEKLPCPYRGLYHFSPDDAEYFFGREVFIEELFSATQTRNFIPVLGASGSGKSSVVLAGLVPKLQQEGHWLFTHFRPGSEPFYALAQALVPLYEPEKNATEQMYQARQLAEYLVNGSVLLKDVFQRIERNYTNHRVLLIADQFEELYTLCSDEKIRRSFLDTLIIGFQSESNHSASPPVLVSTMRVDFLGNALAYPLFADVLRNTDIKIRSMNRSELSDVITNPAQKLGVTFQDGLIERILDDVESEPGNLPLLEFALTLLWEKRTNKQLTHAAYRAIGEIKGALASYADKIYKKLNTAKQQQVSRIFMQLVSPGVGTEDTRRVATKAELGEDNWSLVQDLADARLVVTSRSVLEQETVEVAHEALIQHWQLLQSWIDENRSQIIQKNRIERLAFEWEDNKKLPDYLLQGKQLNEAQAFRKKESASLKLSSLASEFIQQSIKYRRNNRFRLIGFGFIPLVTLAVFLGFFATREIKARQMWAIFDQAKRQKDSPARILALQELVKLGVSLNNIPLTNANLTGANLTDAKLTGAKLTHANLTSANLTGANLTGANLEIAYLDGANLQSANLQSANLQSANLQSANLQSANLTGTNLEIANLDSVNLDGVKFGCIKISEGNNKCTNLSDVEQLTPEQVKAAKNWQQACYGSELRKTLGLPPENQKECKN